MDGELAAAESVEAIGLIADHIRRVQPDVVLTFPHDGIYGHPDHIAISQFATAAVVAAASSSGTGGPAHAVSKLYFRGTTSTYMKLYELAFGELVMNIDGEERRSVGWPEWAITARVDCRAHWRRVWEAVQLHRSQLPGYQRLNALPEEHHVEMWGRQDFYRVMCTVPAPTLETDLVAGVRGSLAFPIATSTPSLQLCQEAVDGAHAVSPTSSGRR